MQAMLPEDAQIWTPYGATECLPVAVIEGRELRETRAATEAGAGTCVGRPVAANTVRIIAITDDAALADWSEVRELARAKSARSPWPAPAPPTRISSATATRLAKIRERLPDGSERIVHRMGDLGWFDERGRLWFCGRKSQRVETAAGPLYTEQVEPVFNTHAEVRPHRAGRRRRARRADAGAVRRAEARRRAREHVGHRGRAAEPGRPAPHTRGIQRVLFHAGFPVDIRHNAKIGREALARWAADILGRGKA
jgi:olefin beta-lactone synthetase